MRLYEDNTNSSRASSRVSEFLCLDRIYPDTLVPSVNTVSGCVLTCN